VDDTEDREEVAEAEDEDGEVIVEAEEEDASTPPLLPPARFTSVWKAVTDSEREILPSTKLAVPH
jgi:hypothetical protein